MSNCIDIKGNVVFFQSWEIDAAALMKEIERVNSGPCPKGGQDAVIWWFLSGNVTLRGTRVNKALEIRFGESRSSHTQRDFRNTLRVIHNYMRMPKPWIFHVKDLDSGIEGYARVKHVFGQLPIEV